MKKKRWHVDKAFRAVATLLKPPAPAAAAVADPSAAQALAS